jgi:hypothetical protein
MNNTLYIPAAFKEIREPRAVEVHSGKRGRFGHERTTVEQQWVSEGYSDCEIDGKRL